MNPIWTTIDCFRQALPDLQKFFKALNVSETNPQPEQQIPPLNILVAEDGLANQMLVKSLLEKWGHTVTIAEDGNVAVEQWRDYPFDLILMDLEMPVIDGYQATHTIRQEEQTTGKHIPIVTMTAHEDTELREKCLAAGMDEFVSKPFQQAELYAVLAPIFSPDNTADDANATPSANQNQYSADSPSLIDWNHAISMAADEEAILHRLIRACLNELPQLLAGLKTSVQEGNATEATRFAHTIKSAGRNFGIQRLLESAHKIEHAAVNDDLITVKELLVPLEVLIDEVITALQSRLAN